LPPALPDSVVQELQGLKESKGNQTLSEVSLEMKERSKSSNLGQEYQATIALAIKSVPHHFAGGWSATPLQASQNAAARLLWYLGIDTSGFLAVPEHSVKAAESTLPAQLSQQAVNDVQPGPAGAAAETATPQQSAADPKANLEERTVLMQVQNSLQKAFAKDTPTGEKVWVWSYEADDKDSQMFRALAEIPAIRQTFIGDWCRGKKLAQRNCCMVVKEFLESPEGLAAEKAASA